MITRHEATYSSKKNRKSERRIKDNKGRTPNWLKNRRTITVEKMESSERMTPSIIRMNPSQRKHAYTPHWDKKTKQLNSLALHNADCDLWCNFPTFAKWLFWNKPARTWKHFKCKLSFLFLKNARCYSLVLYQHSKDCWAPVIIFRYWTLHGKY